MKSRREHRSRRLRARFASIDCQSNTDELIGASIKEAGRSVALPGDKPIHDQHEQGAADRDGHATPVERGNVAEAEQVAPEEADDDGATDSEHDGKDGSSALLVWHDELRQEADDQARDDPRQNTHATDLQEAVFEQPNPAY
jgi:hypothetical protein